jgi:hypothetical protein
LLATVAMWSQGCTDASVEDDGNGTATETGSDVHTDSDSDTEDLGLELRVESAAPLFVVAGANDGLAADLDFLAATAAASAISQGAPAVLMVADTSELKTPWTADYLARYPASLVVGIGLDPKVVGLSVPTLSLTETHGAPLSMALARAVWSRSARVVLAPADDPAAAIVAASLAARLSIPFLVWDASRKGELDALLQELRTETALLVGGMPVELDVAVTPLADDRAVATWLEQNGFEVNYLVAINPHDDAAQDGPRLSRLAPMFASRRQGATVLLPNTTDPNAVRASLSSFTTALGHPPAFLALLGSSEAIPFARVPNPLGMADVPELMTDAPYAQIDDDAFIEIAIGRIVASNLVEGSLVASRITTYEQLFDGAWEQTFIESGLWGYGEIAPLLRNVGYDDPWNTIGVDLGTFERIEAGILLHKDHSNHVALGHAFDMSTPTLLAPTVVVSGGCWVAGIDADTSSGHQSIVRHMLRQGAVAFVGGPRYGIAQDTQAHVAFINGLIEGLPLGQAFAKAYNNTTLNILDNPGDGGSEYARNNTALLGDPGLVIPMPNAPAAALAHMTVEGPSLLVKAPAALEIDQVTRSQLDEWKWSADLYIVVGGGLEPHTFWGSGHDEQIMYFMASFTTDKQITGIEQDPSVIAPMGFENYHLDPNPDGTTTARWRVRLNELDPLSGTLTKQLTSVSYTVSFE